MTINGLAKILESSAATGCAPDPTTTVVPAHGVHGPPPDIPGRTSMRTFGVEEELLVVDPSSGIPLPLAGQILAEVAAGAHGAQMGRAGDITHEFKLEQIEVATAPCRTAVELLDGIRAGRELADAGARSVGARLAAVGTPPVHGPTHAAPDSRYAAMEERFGLIAAEQITCGCHVHVSIDSPAEGVAVLNGLRPWLPTLLALSANSPYWNGQDSGFASYRTQVWNRWPATGPTSHFTSMRAYRSFMAAITAAGVLLDEGMVYFDARLSRRHPTIEVRIADVCLEADDAAVIAALVRALVATSAQDWQLRTITRPAPTAVLRLGNWLGSRFGTSGELLHPTDLLPRPAAEVVAALFDHVERSFDGPAERAYVESGLAKILIRGTGERCQRSARDRHGRLSDAVAAAFV
ncbi:glutamate--cysteine ligase [Pseudarthrobacter sp. P1]|uniref:glutamate--cysteine ligase n=1 Tax=Pseudarthrobacter sp. P1 TaxID=3418418 RepID=UPI003CE6856E